MAELSVEGPDLADVTDFREVANRDSVARIHRAIVEALNDGPVPAPADLVCATMFIAAFTGFSAHARPTAMLRLFIESWHASGGSYPTEADISALEQAWGAPPPARAHPRVRRDLRPNGRHR